MKTYRTNFLTGCTHFERSNHDVFDYANGELILWSYASTIFKANFNKKMITFFRHFNYSSTTTKHRNSVLSEYGLYELTGASSNIYKAIEDGKVDINGYEWTVEYSNEFRI